MEHAYVHSENMTDEQATGLSLAKEGAIRLLCHSSRPAWDPSVTMQHIQAWSSNLLLSVLTQVHKLSLCSDQEL